MVIRCEACDKKIWPEGHSLWDSWKCLYFYFELQLAEEEITEETFRLLVDHLLKFKFDIIQKEK